MSHQHDRVLPHSQLQLNGASLRHTDQPYKEQP